MKPVISLLAFCVLTLLSVSLQAADPPQSKLDVYGDPLPADADVRLGTARFRHTAQTLPFLQRQIAFADNRSVVSVFGNSVHFYACDSGELLREFNLDEEAVRVVRISPDRQSLVTMSFLQNQTAPQPAYRTRFWRINTGELLSTLEQSEQFTQSAFTSDGQSFITADGDIVKFWDVATGERLLTYELGIAESIRNLTVSPLENQLIAFTTSRNVYLWDWLSGARPVILTRDWPQFQSLVFSPTQSQLAVIADAGRRVQIWDTASLKLIREFKSSAVHHLDLSVLEYTPDGRTLIGTRSADPKTDETGIVFWDLASGNLQKTLRAHSGRPSQVIVSPDGKRMALQAACVHTWNLETGECLSDRLIGHEAPVTLAAFGPDSRTLITAGADATVRVWDPESGRQLHSLTNFPSSWIYATALSHDGKRIAASFDSNTLIVGDTQSGQQLCRVTNEPENQELFMSFTLDSTRLLCLGNDKILRTRDAASGTILAEQKIQPSPPAPLPTQLIIIGSNRQEQRESKLFYATFTAGARRLILNYSPTVYTFDIDSGAEIGNFSLETSTHLWGVSPDGRLLMTSGSRRVENADDPATGPSIEYFLKLIQLPTGLEVWSEVFPEGGLYGPVSFSPDGQLVAVGFHSPHPEIRIWDVKSHEQQLVIDDVPGLTLGNTISFSTDNRKLACAQPDYSVLIWDLLEEGLPEELLAIPLTQERQ